MITIISLNSPVSGYLCTSSSDSYPITLMKIKIASLLVFVFYSTKLIPLYTCHYVICIILQKFNIDCKKCISVNMIKNTYFCWNKILHAIVWSALHFYYKYFNIYLVDRILLLLFENFLHFYTFFKFFTFTNI